MKLVDAVAPEASAEVATAWFTALVRAAMVPAGAARWRMSWAGQLELVMPDGEIFDAESLAAELADSSTARDAAARLTALGVDVAAVGPVSTTAAVDAGDVVAGISDLRGRIPPRRVDPWHSVAAMVALHRFVPFESIASRRSPVDSPSKRPSNCATAQRSGSRSRCPPNV